MKISVRILAALVVVALVAASCSSGDGDGTDAAGSTEADSAEGTATTAAVSEEVMEEEDPVVEKPVVSIAAVTFSTSTVTISNDGDTELVLEGMFMCNRPNYVGLAGGTVAPGATLDIDVTELDLRSSSGEFALYLADDFGNADAIVAYVQWGSGENGRASVAVEAGLITEGDFIANGEEDIVIG